MKTSFIWMVLKGKQARRAVTLPRVALLVVALSALTYGAQIQVFWDDFESYPAGDNPGVPPIGEPWQITEPATDGIQVWPNPAGQESLAMRFGRYRNVVVAPFSALDRQQIASAQTLTMSFDYTGFAEPASPYTHYFDVAAYDPISGSEAFFVRFSPEENPGSGGLHDVLYLDPAGGLADSGLDVAAGNDGVIQPITIVADFAAETYQLDVGGNSATLPMFFCPDEVAGVEFSNYAMAMGTGILANPSVIDNLSVTVPEPEPKRESTQRVPEIATVLLLLIGAITLSCFRLLRR